MALLKASDLPDNAQICNCNGVSKKQIVDAIRDQGLPERFQGRRLHQGRHRAAVRARAWWRSCSKPVVGEVGYDPTEHYYVPGVPLEKSQLVAEIRSRGIKSVSEVFRATGRTARKIPPARSASRRC